MRSAVTGLVRITKSRRPRSRTTNENDDDHPDPDSDSDLDLDDNDHTNHDHDGADSEIASIISKLNQGYIFNWAMWQLVGIQSLKPGLPGSQH